MTTFPHQGDGGYDSEYDILFWIDDYDEVYNTSKEKESEDKEKESEKEVMSHWYEEDQIYKKDFRT